MRVTHLTGATVRRGGRPLWAAARAAACLAALTSCGRERSGAPPRGPATQSPPARTRTAAEAPSREQALLDRLAADPSDVHARLALASLYYHTARPHLAAPAYRQALKQRPNDPAVLTRLGNCYKRMGQPDQARAEHDRAARALLARLAKSPGDVDARLALANLYYDADKPHLAIPAYLEVLKHRPDEPGIRTDLGTCYKRMGNLDQARAQLEHVIRDHPRHVPATYNLAVVIEQAGDKLRAAELWERVAATAPGTPIARASLTHAAAARRAAERPSTPDAATPTGKGSTP